MRPFLKGGEIAAVVKDSRYSPGDIVAYNIDKKCYIHRILKKKDKSYFIRDDVSILDGHWIKESNILGKVSGVPFYGTPGKLWNVCIRNFYSIMRRIKNYVTKVTEKINIMRHNINIKKIKVECIKNMRI